MHVPKCIIERSPGEELGEVGRNPLDRDYGHKRSGQERDLTRVESPGTQEEGRFRGNRLKAGHGRR